MAQTDAVMTTAEVASALRISEKTARDLAARNRLPAVRVGRLLRFSRVGIEEMIRGRPALPDCLETG